MRRLDRLVGLPLCHALTLVRALLPCRRAAAPPRRILCIQLAEAGSMVLADPTLAAIERHGAEPYFVTLAGNAPALCLTGRVPPERIFALRDGSMPRLVADAWRLRRWVRQQEIDAIVDMELFARLTAILAVWCGVSRRAGFHDAAGGALYRGDLYSDPVRFNPHIHIARNYLRLIEPWFGSDRSGEPLRIRRARPTAAARAHVARLLAELDLQTGGRVVLVNPNASDRLPQRRWPADRYVELIEQLLAIRPDVTVLLIGAAEDRATTARISLQVDRGRCIDIAGRVPLEFLPALFERAHLLIGNDSGPAHFAAVGELPVVVLFGPETPGLFAPLGPATVLSAGLSCSPCVSPANQRKSSCTDNRCMQGIDVASVLAASLDWLTRTPVRRAVLPVTA